MRSDIEIAHSIEPEPIIRIAERLSIEGSLIPYGNLMAKVPVDISKDPSREEGKLILLTAMTPTPFGEGKTTNTIGLTQSLKRIGKSAAAAIREPSLGPCMGVKGGAAGGGYSQVLPMEEINLHFTGDLHAVTAAHNLLSAMIDNHIHQHKQPLLDPAKVTWKRVIDMNDRSLRNIVIGMSDHGENGQARCEGFEITAASEVMAVLCLSEDLEDLKHRLGRIIIGKSFDGELIQASQIHAQGAMAALLKQAVMPNLVQTIEGAPVFIHGGPFANIAHGCNSIIATRTAMKLADYTVTEAGFASELGAEKFFNITCRAAGFRADAVVLVVTRRAYMIHGIENIMKHVENIRKHSVPVAISINRFLDDPQEELEVLRDELREAGVDTFITDFRESGGAGGLQLAEYVVELCSRGERSSLLYELDTTINERIEKICKEVYGAAAVSYKKGVKTKIKRLVKDGHDDLPICMAKTQMSLSDDPKASGRPEGFTVNVSDIRVKAGAGFLVVYTSDVMTMPGLPKVPAAEHIDITASGEISGLF